MEQELVRELAILGGGTAGWMTAAALARALNGKVRLTVVESEESGTIGVGEATIPPIMLFNQMLGIDEDEFLRETKGSFKLGIGFVDWEWQGNRYLHAFGNLPGDIQLASFEQIWRCMRQHGHQHALGEYSITHAAAYAGKFTRPDGAHPLLGNLGYAFHFDASAYARYLRRYSERSGVMRIEGKVSTANLDAATNDITSLFMKDGRAVHGEFFIDCSGLSLTGKRGSSASFPLIRVALC